MLLKFKYLWGSNRSYNWRNWRSFSLSLHACIALGILLSGELLLMTGRLPSKLGMLDMSHVTDSLAVPFLEAAMLFFHRGRCICVEVKHLEGASEAASPITAVGVLWTGSEVWTLCSGRRLAEGRHCEAFFLALLWKAEQVCVVYIKNRGDSYIILSWSLRSMQIWTSQWTCWLQRYAALPMG